MSEVIASINSHLSETIYLIPDQVEQWVIGILKKGGLAEDDAAAVAENLVAAECRGMKSHGLVLLPIYLNRIKKGGIRARYSISTLKETGPLLLCDGGGGPGQALARRVMQMAIERATRFGISYLLLNNSNHIGMLATYGLQATARGLIGIVMTNSSPSVNAYRGRGPQIGSNAICVAVPSEPDPFVLDMSTGTVACSRVRLAALHKRTIPAEWITDHCGLPSQDPLDIDRGGAVTPLGGYKGYGLTVALDIMTALLAGGSPSYLVLSQISIPSEPTGASQSFAAIDPDFFIGRERLVEAMHAYIENLRQLMPSDSDFPVLAPGDPELMALRRAEINGIEISLPVFKTIERLAIEFDLPMPTPQEI